MILGPLGGSIMGLIQSYVIIKEKKLLLRTPQNGFTGDLFKIPYDNLHSIFSWDI